MQQLSQLNQAASQLFLEHKATRSQIEGTLSPNLKSGKSITHMTITKFVEFNLLIRLMPAINLTLYIIMEAFKTAAIIFGHLILHKKLQP